MRSSSIMLKIKDLIMKSVLAAFGHSMPSPKMVWQAYFMPVLA